METLQRLVGKQCRNETRGKVKKPPLKDCNVMLVLGERQISHSYQTFLSCLEHFQNISW